jgi:hypothetical protein
MAQYAAVSFDGYRNETALAFALCSVTGHVSSVPLYVPVLPRMTGLSFTKCIKNYQ